MEQKSFQEFLKELEQKLIPLSRECNELFFNATISGKDEDYKKSEECQIKLEHIFSNKEDFEYLKSIRADAESFGGLDKRQYEKVYKSYLSNQIDEKLLDEMIRIQTEIEKKFAKFRPKIAGKSVTDNEIDEILTTTTDQKEAEAAWLASKEVGTEVAETVKKIVRLRNEAAKALGFDNFHQMSLTLSDQKPEEIDKIFDELDALTKQPYAESKEELNAYSVQKFGIEKPELMPWHLQDRFLQKAPRIYELNLDKYFTDKDLVKITADFYGGIGLPVQDIIEKSDLFEREGKYQHAYCLDVDRDGDIRMVCNVKPNHKWMDTMLHEAGHAVYDKGINKDLPWFLRRPAHIFTTEAIAMLFGSLATKSAWIKEMVGISEKDAEEIEEECKKTLRLEKLIFCRWTQVMYRFEKAMYQNPDQDLNQLWWDLVEKYQLIKKPEGRDAPDWAAKIHIASFPAYYHNYQLGELLASQIKNYIKSNISERDDFVGEKKVGDYLKERVFKPGKKYEWNEMIKRATGEKLTAKYFAKEFVDK